MCSFGSRIEAMQITMQFGKRHHIASLTLER
jgi:hypothetical protein